MIFSENSSNGDQQLKVTVELNGILYEGVLLAKSTSTNSPSTPILSKSNGSKDDDIQ